jgi:3-oxoacyl-[acyl-carrier-protein] synthase II
MDNHRCIVITGIEPTAPNGNTLAEYRANLLKGVSGVVWFEPRYMGKVLAGVCNGTLDGTG